MSDNQHLLNQLKELLHLKKSKEFYAKRLGISKEQVYLLFKEMKKQRTGNNSDIFQKSVKVNSDKGTIESTIVCDFEPKTHEQLASLHKIDLNSYVITNYWSKLLPNGKFTSSVFSKRKMPEDYSPEDFLKLLENYKSNYIPATFPTVDVTKFLVDVELSLSDYHLAKRHIDGDNDISDRVFRYLNTAESLIKKVSSCYQIGGIVFPISNDFFHTDNYQQQTTNGTPQDTMMDYAQEYEAGFNLLVDTIKMLLANSQVVRVVLVQGNHDRTKSFYLAHGLEVYFQNEPRVSFDRQHGVVKGVTLGNTFIGYHHGNCKIDDLPLLFATHPAYCAQFGISKYREVHTGDKHHYMAKDIKGVRIQQMPSLSGVDRWHLDNNFVHSIRAALALVYDPVVGKVAEFEERI